MPLTVTNKIYSTSHAMQDTFVLDTLGKNKRWLEIGANNPVNNGNNTNLLELHGWTGVSLEIDPHFKSVWHGAGRRTDEFFVCNAVSFDYSQFCGVHFDYIQIDVDPTNSNYEILKKVINSGITCDIITYEHDVYKEPSHFKTDGYEFATANGYRRVIENAAKLDEPRIMFEDWYVSERVDFEPINFYEWAKPRYGKYCQNHYNLVCP